MSKSIQGFSKLGLKERLARLHSQGILDAQAMQLLQQSDPNYVTLADHCIENAIGTMQVPLGIAMHFKIDGNDYAIPMAVEESSIIAAASGTAKWIRQQGYITTQNLGTDIIGQIQFPRVNDIALLTELLATHKISLIKEVNEKVLPTLIKRGGGVNDLQLRTLARPDGKTMGVIHVHLNPCDAMGANYVTQACEFLKPKLMQLSNENIALCIVSNLCDTQLVRADIIIQKIDKDLGHAISEASLFACIDPYRAATHNKGIMNAIDALLLATGNDWRAVEAGMHAYAARHGSYTALSYWELKGDDLVGSLIAPINVGTVGGMTRLHPMAQLALKILQVQKAQELSRIAAAVGLVQNLAALRALVSTGLVAGHMRLHIHNLIYALKANKAEKAYLQATLQQHLQQHKKISLSDAQAYLNTYRSQSSKGIAS